MWSPGTVVVRREVLNDGRAWLEVPVIVVRDDEELLATFIAEGAPDPRPLYDELRREAPVYRTPFDFWYVTRYDLGTAISRDPENWTVRKPDAAHHHAGNFAFVTWERVMLMMDGPDHARLRRLVSTIFTPRAARGSGA